MDYTVPRTSRGLAELFEGLVAEGDGTGPDGAMGWPESVFEDFGEGDLHLAGLRRPGAVTASPGAFRCPRYVH